MSEAIDPDAELLFAMQVTALGKDSTSRQTMRDILAAVRAHDAKTAPQFVTVLPSAEFDAFAAAVERIENDSPVQMLTVDHGKGCNDQTAEIERLRSDLAEAAKRADDLLCDVTHFYETRDGFVATIEAQKAEIAYLRSLREAQTDLTIKLAAALADIAERAEGCSPEAYCLGMVARKALGEELQ